MVVMKKRQCQILGQGTQNRRGEENSSSEKVVLPSDETPPCVTSVRLPDHDWNGGETQELEKTVRLSFSIGWELHRRLKLEAVRSCRTISGLVEQWIGEHAPAA